MAKKNLYEILEVDADASQADVKKSYRKLARQYHPDLNPEDDEAAKMFKLVKEAYDVLSNPLERDKYDEMLFSGAGGGSTDWDDEDEEEDIFANGDGSMSSATARSDAPVNGNDLRYDLEITFEDSAFGLETEIRLQRSSGCDVCSSTGTEPGTQTEPCMNCNGTGRVNVTRSTPYGPQTTTAVCEVCHGRGRIVPYPCARCNGTGQIQVFDSIPVKIPPGVDEGARLRIRGRGEPGQNGGTPGDLYIVVHIKDHPIFERHGNEILCEKQITFAQAVFGAEIEVPTLEGAAKMKIPPGTQTGTIFRLRGKGIWDSNSGARGDQHVKVSIMTPVNLTDKQKGLLLKFAQSLGEDTRYLGR